MSVSQKVGNRRLLKLAAFLRGLKRNEFDYSHWVRKGTIRRGHACGTVCCAGGWCPRVFPRQWRWRDYGFAVVPQLRERWGLDIYGHLAAFFGLTEPETQFLFLPRCSGLPPTATAKQVARHIERFVARRERGLPGIPPAASGAGSKPRRRPE